VGVAALLAATRTITTVQRPRRAGTSLRGGGHRSKPSGLAPSWDRRVRV